MGRIDDVINISGHRLGTAEVESALVAHEAVAEAAVVGYPHDTKVKAYMYMSRSRKVSRRQTTSRKNLWRMSARLSVR